MNNNMSYLMGMITGNGQIKRGNTRTGVSISIPHKNQKTDDGNSVKVYIKASITDIRNILVPILGTGLELNQRDSETIISFEKDNSDYLITEILRLCNGFVSSNNMRVNEYFLKSATNTEVKYFLRGFADVTGYIRESNYFFNRYANRVYLEIPHNWLLVVDICNLLRLLDIPVQTIDWAHPNMRDGNLTKYNIGNKTFWKKEHQIKIYANEFLPIGFGVIHKKEALMKYAKILTDGLKERGKTPSDVTHRYYWQLRKSAKVKPIHPCENDTFIPAGIRGKHYNNWKEIAFDLGYKE